MRRTLWTIRQQMSGEEDQRLQLHGMQTHQQVTVIRMQVESLDISNVIRVGATAEGKVVTCKRVLNVSHA